MRKLWLVFTQTATVCLAVLFVVSTLRPDLLSWNLRRNVVTIKESSPQPAAGKINSFSVAAKKAMPAVVNVFTTKEVKVPRHPFMDDPVFRYFFGDQFDAQTQQSTNLGSGVIVSERRLHPDQQSRGRSRRRYRSRAGRCAGARRPAWSAPIPKPISQC